ncbi:MarR family transcriptional regulator [Noviherbaspirillum saxi]|uniref:MarR family transcriptional regulator n=1 Tax=Noviherbaspirillum saxi TaxID=2320863 RepID=A0A3A3FLQ9_9BURK|nr:MarR family transcriptional regulator [Noviherbaspirillum saxi]
MAKTTIEATTLYMLAGAHHGVRTLIESALKPLDLTPLQYTVLSIIEHRPGLSSAALARRFYVTAQNMGQLLVTLEKRGLLTRLENEENRRHLTITLTDEGHRLQAVGASQMQLVERAVLANVPKEAVATLRETLATIIATLRS